MRLLPSEHPLEMVQGTICRHSRWVSLVGAALMGAMMIGIPAFLVWHAPLPTWLKLCGAGLAGLVARWLIGNVIKSCRRSNWVLRISPDGLWINIRSYLNHELPPARTIVHLTYDEILRVCEHAAKRAEQSSDGVTKWTDRYLDIQLVDAALDELRAELAEERRRYVSRSYLFGLVKGRSRSGHVPVTVPSDNLIRISWRGRFDWVTPSLRHVLRELQGRVAVGETTRADLSNWQSFSSEEIDSLTLQLVESGDKMGAVKLLTDRRGYTTTEAHRFVEELTAAL